MPNYRRPWVEGATYFVTVVTYQRRPLLASGDAMGCLRDAMTRARDEKPFEVVAAVVLPDHWHAVLTLPPGDADLSSRVGRIKALFTKATTLDGSVNSSWIKHRESDVWQRRFFDRLIRNETELERRIDYMHFNPVKHGYCKRPIDWPHSSLKRYVAAGVLPEDWGTSTNRDCDLDLSDDMCGEP